MKKDETKTNGKNKNDNYAITFKIDWKKFPERQLEMLEDFMGIDRELISTYYISKLSVEEIRKDIISQLSEYIDKNRGTVDCVDEPKPKTAKKKKQ